MIGYFSSGIGRIPYLDKLLQHPCRRIKRMTDSSLILAVAGWGLKETSVQARNYAAIKHLPYLSLEDGFLRSLGLGVDGALQHSLIVDYHGIYYDATRPSDLELLIKEEYFTVEELKRAEHGIEILRRHRLAKYNHAPDRLAPIALDDKSRVLVVDQTYGDASVQYGLADASHFRLMLESAIKDNPDAQILVKIHPDVISGKKRGYLSKLVTKYSCTLIAEDTSPWALLDVVDKVYVVTSQFGFEALLAGKQVCCFGLPFYAGWGLTEDYQVFPRRGETRSLEQVFAAAYLRYCRYINPYTGERCEFEDTVALLSDQKRQCERYSGGWLAIGFSGWKRSFVASFLGRKAALHFISSVHKLRKGGLQDQKMLIWASDNATYKALCDSNNESAISFMEDGFIRSVGLGADLVAPISLVVDTSGIYYDATRTSDLEVMLQTEKFSEDLLARAKRLRKRLVDLKLSKYNVGSAQLLNFPAGKRIILVPGQVETDASIKCGSPEIKTNAHLLRVVREACPDAYIVYKPHPDVLSGARLADDPSEREELFDLLVTDISMPDLLEQVDEVHTLTSLTGFEALLRGKQVYTYGLPFYAGWGLSRDYLSCSRRNRQLTLDQLVAAALILYPIYVDPVSGDQVNAETAVDILCRRRKQPISLSVKSKIWQKIRKPV